jgi:hypothetical protein
MQRNKAPRSAGNEPGAKLKERLVLERIATAFREHAHRSNSSIEEEAEALRVSRASAYQLAGGRSARARRAEKLPGLDIFRRLVHHTGHSADWILGYDVPELRGASQPNATIEADVEHYVATLAAAKAGVTTEFAESVVRDVGGARLLEQAAERLAIDVREEADRERAARARAGQRLVDSLTGRNKLIKKVGDKKRLDLALLFQSHIQAVRREASEEAADARRVRRPNPDAVSIVIGKRVPLRKLTPAELRGIAAAERSRDSARARKQKKRQTRGRG